MKRNAEIEIYRFLMTIGVIILHFSEDYSAKYHFKGGYLGVDFFFMVSGYFLMTHYYRYNLAECCPEENAIKYTTARIKKLYMPYLTAILLMTLVMWIDFGGGLRGLYSLLYEHRWQFLMLHSVGAPTKCIIRSVWFLSPLILLSYFIYFALCFNKKFFVGIAPIISILLYAFIAQEYGFLGMHFNYAGIFVGGIIRGLAGMAMGVFLAYLVEEYYKKNPIQIKEFTGILARIFCYMVIFVTMITSKWKIEDFDAIPMFVILILLAFLSPLKIKCERAFVYLGGISYWIYLVHLIVGYVISTYIPGREYSMMLIIYIVGTILLSALLKFLYQNVGKIIKKY